MNRNYYIIIDTETAGELEKPLVYDIGYIVTDKKGNIYESKSYVIYDIYVEQKALMQTAYYAEKLPQYEIELADGRRKMVRLATVKKEIENIIKKYNVTAIIAHNMRFDLNAVNNTIRYITNNETKYFFPYGVKIWDTLTMARETIGKQKTYIKWCKENGYITKNKQVKLTAEILYRYLTQNKDFIESHTALEDVLIEKEIFTRCLRQKKKCG